MAPIMLRQAQHDRTGIGRNDDQGQTLPHDCAAVKKFTGARLFGVLCNASLADGDFQTTVSAYQCPSPIPQELTRFLSLLNGKIEIRMRKGLIL